jgi:citrate lyase subunit beta / citryl-CoA lyase
MRAQRAHPKEIGMKMRSLLFVPGDRPDQMKKALKAGADALIFDLEDSVAAGNKAEARRAVTEFLQGHPKESMWVRINPLDSPEADRDLAVIIAGRPDGIVLPKAEGGASVSELARRLSDRGNVTAMILAIATETPAAMFGLGTYAGVKRLAGLSWGAEDLSAAVGASTARDEDGGYTAPYEIARALCLFGAAAAGVAAIDTVYTELKDPEGLAAYAERARQDGFTGMLAIHPDQVKVINKAFTPSKEEVARAQAIIDAFRASPGVGVLSIEGRMVDRPHLLQAQRIVAAAG